MKKYNYKKPIINQKKIKLTFFSSMNRTSESIIELAQASSNNCVRCGMHIEGKWHEWQVCPATCCPGIVSIINVCR
jgi:hypothetical protein